MHYLHNIKSLARRIHTVQMMHREKSLFLPLQGLTIQINRSFDLKVETTETIKRE